MPYALTLRRVLADAQGQRTVQQLAPTAAPRLRRTPRMPIVAPGDTLEARDRTYRMLGELASE